jgi:sugar O-acyltransferase (sialic acid O-acetyltransferase NeuD family)
VKNAVPKPLVILGTYGLAEEMLDLISDNPDWRVDAFVENWDRRRCDFKIDGVPVIWVDELAGMVKSHVAICSLGSSKRQGYIEQVEQIGMAFATIVHPTARISSRATLADGCFVGAHSVISTKTELGKCVFLNRGVLIGHHVRIGNYVTIQCGANIASHVEVGSRTFVGMGAVIMDQKKIGAGSIVGAGAVVTHDVPEATQVVGVPARVVKENVEAK